MTIYTKDSREWLLIRANTGFWFSKNTMAFFGSKVYWNTLTEIPMGYLFISSEDSFDKDRRLFSIRKVVITKDLDNNDVYNLGTLEWQTLEDLKSAKKALDTQAKFITSLYQPTPPTVKEQI